MYRGPSGQWSWLLHRVTGLGVLLFLLVHIVDITLIGFGPTVYNDALLVFSTGIVRLISLALIGAVLYHAFNGVRIILIDFWPTGYKYQRAMFYGGVMGSFAVERFGTERLQGLRREEIEERFQLFRELTHLD